MTAAPEQTQFRLLILGEGSVRTFALSGSRWTIGRSQDCCIPLRDPTVSRRHLLLERDGDTFTFQDLGGANPPQIDGKTVRHGTLTVGQALTIGLSQLVLEQRRRPMPVATNPTGTVVLSREVIDEDEPAANGTGFPATASRVLQRIEWTFADLGDLSDAAEPLLDLALNLTDRRSGWIARFHAHGAPETLAAISSVGGAVKPSLPQGTMTEARQIGKPHVLSTQEEGATRKRLLIPLGNDPGGLIVLEDPGPDAPHGQELLRLAQSLGTVVWHRLQETMERRSLREELERLRFRGTASHNALLTSTRLQPAREQLRALAGGEQAVLLVGENGTERPDLARYLHAESTRRAAPFLVWQPMKTAIDRHAAELFGSNEHAGLLQRVEGGTLFVEDPTLLTADVQRRLALAIAERRGKPDGARLVVATTPEESPKSAPERWADELRHALDDDSVFVPPLRNEVRDIIALAELFLSELGTRADGSPRLMTERSKRALSDYQWPGNVRELRLTIESAAATAGNNAIAPRHLPANVTGTGTSSPQLPTLDEVERSHIASAMQLTGGNRQRAAQMLGIAASTLYEKLKKLRIEI